MASRKIPEADVPPARQAPRPFLPAEPIVPTVAVPRPQAISAEQALNLAAQIRQQGDLAQAEALLKQILQIQPQNHAAWHELGLIAYDVGKPDMAIQLLSEAIKHGGKVAMYHANIGEMYRQCKNLDKAVAHGRKAVELDPKLAYARSNLGIAYYDLKDYDKAETCHKMVFNLAPHHAPSLNNMGSICRDRDEDDAAIDWYTRAATADPAYLEPRNNLGATLLRLEKIDDAFAVLDEALRINPRYAEALCNKGYAFFALERYDDALQHFNAALQLRPVYAEAYLGLANVFRERLMLDDAETLARRALDCATDKVDCLCALGAIYTSQGRSDLAEEAYKKALEIEPDSASAQRGIGHIRLEDGQLEEAEKIFAANVGTGRDRVASLFSLTQSRKVKPDDDIVAQMEAEEKNIAALSDGKKIFLHFGLGKIYDDIGEADKAFPHFIEGCRLKRARIPFDPMLKEEHFKRIRAVFTPEFMTDRAGHGYASDVPIFVVGMPRSGTTLTEQIISSHPSVFGAGEIFDFLDLIGSNNKDGSLGFPDITPAMPLSGYADIGKRYVDGLRARAKGAAPRVTDKMPINFQHIGMIKLALPQAKIVHIERHPLDTCVSCFTRLFAHNQNSTYDLRELGRFYKGYHDTMQHWRKTLPAGSFYELRYEDLVENTEEQARKLLDYCALEWDDRCLDFHKNDRSIRTASVMQVRQPIYKTSVARWKKYEKFLQPLIEELGDAMPKA